MAELELAVELTDMVGDYPYPSVLIDGTDVMGGTTTGPSAARRLDLLTADTSAPR
jgi:hypothetical protein